jgi:hypothetical protein
MRRLLIVVAAALAAAAGSVSYARNDIVGEWDHFTRCFDLMVNNTPRQLRECDPAVNRSVFSNNTLATPVTGSPTGPTLPVSSSSTSGS